MAAHQVRELKKTFDAEPFKSRVDGKQVAHDVAVWASAF